MTDPIEFDKLLTEIALQRLKGDDRYAVLEAASRLRRYRELGAQVKATLELL